MAAVATIAAAIFMMERPSVGADAAQTTRRPTTRASAPARPALVVLLVIDQFRADYVARYGDQWTGGLHRLFTGGAYFRQAAYPYAATETCPGHTTIATGALPATHGIVANGWYDRATKRPIVCTDDDVTPVGVDDDAYEKHGPGRIRVNTLADELRAQVPGGSHVVTLSLKARSAIALAGHAGDAVLWHEDAGAWATSSRYAANAPAAAVAFTKAHSVVGEYERAWTLLRPASTYAFADDGLSEQAPDGWGTMFPHTLARPNGPDRIYFDNWRRTPFSDEYLGAMGAALAKDLGQGPGIDLLGISFSATDMVGHRFGPTSWEVQDTLARLDVTIGRLLAALDATVGAGRYVVALSADHGVAPIPEQLAAIGVDAGRVSAAPIQEALDAVLTRELGARDHFMPGSLDAGNKTSDVYFAPAVLRAIRERADLRAALTQAALSAPGVARAIWADELAALASGGDREARALQASFSADRNGDLLIVSKPYWVGASGGTGHGTSYGYDQRVPVLFYGFGVTPGTYDTPASPADIAPTLASIVGVTLAQSDGRVLAIR
jgi:predicted AlkP superfamily pyrophosphatase or phosphodiesterase